MSLFSSCALHRFLLSFVSRDPVLAELVSLSHAVVVVVDLINVGFTEVVPTSLSRALVPPYIACEGVAAALYSVNGEPSEYSPPSACVLALQADR